MAKNCKNCTQPKNANTQPKNAKQPNNEEAKAVINKYKNDAWRMR